MDFFDILLAKKLEDDRDPKVEGLSVTTNGTYSEDGVVYKPVVVNVPETPLSSLAVTANGTYTPPTGTGYNEVSVNVPLPENAYLLEEYSDVPTDIASFTASDAPLKSLTVSIEPQQDLHGYDSPWVGGSGKNKLPMTVDGIKSANTSGTWSGNAYTLNGVTFTIQTDSDGNVIGIDAHGLASANATLDLNPSVNFNASIVMTGCPSGGSDSTYEMLTTSGNHRDRGTGAEWTWDTNNVVRIVIRNSYNASHVLFNPMIRLSTVSDATFAPYENICPISGWTEEVVYVRGVNQWDEEWENGYWNVTTGQPVANNEYIRCKDFIFVKPSTTFKLVNSATTSYKNEVLFFDKSKTLLSYVDCYGNGNFTTPSNCYYIKFYMNINYGSSYNNDISINYPSTDTEYHAYSGSTTTIPFVDGQGQSVTVYGGSDEVVSGALTVDTKYYGDLSDITFELSANGQYYWSRSTTIPYALTQYDGLCSHFEYGGNKDVLCGISDLTGRYILFFKNKIDEKLGISTISEFNTWLATQSTNGTPVQLWYKLATPNAPIQQQPTSIKSIDGENNLWASTGQIESLEFFTKETS